MCRNCPAHGYGNQHVATSLRNENMKHLYKPLKIHGYLGVKPLKTTPSEKRSYNNFSRGGHCALVLEVT
jgi:hypothetical protein